MKKNPRKKSKKKLLIFFLLLLVAGGLVFFAMKMNGKDEPAEKKAKVVDEIENFDYTVSETDTKLFKDEFKKLKKVLSQKEVDNKEYSNEVAKLFVIDFFTLDNKITKNDVGGVQFVYSGYKTTFIDKARDEFYKYVKSNVNGDRTQELPEVASVEVTGTESVVAGQELSGEQFSAISEAYKVNLTWTYKKDLGYQTKASLIVVKDNDKFAVAKMN